MKYYHVQIYTQFGPGHFLMQVDSERQPIISTHGGHQPVVQLTEITQDCFDRLMAPIPRRDDEIVRTADVLDS